MCHLLLQFKIYPVGGNKVYTSDDANELKLSNAITITPRIIII